MEHFGEICGIREQRDRVCDVWYKAGKRLSDFGGHAESAGYRIYDMVTGRMERSGASSTRKETTLAQQKQQAIKAVFRGWIWERLNQRETLVAQYNAFVTEKVTHKSANNRIRNWIRSP